ncbi:MAG TPA: hypothetical protein PLQ52_13200, partial [Lacunisphaera sp.]|nr:hypothetical protein [Lacunisphaera sp.]
GLRQITDESAIEKAIEAAYKDKYGSAALDVSTGLVAAMKVSISGVANLGAPPGLATPQKARFYKCAPSVKAHGAARRKAAWPRPAMRRCQRR